MRRTWVLIVTVLVSASTVWGQTPQPLLCDLSRVLHKPGEVTAKDNKKVPAGTVELVDGQFGKACKFTLVESTGPQFFTAWVNPTDDRDQFDGFSFWVKGDGSTSCGGLELIDGDDFGLRYGYCFPIQSKDWVKVTVPWSDVVPELAGAPVDAKQGYAPNRFRNVWVGKWFYWRDYPACSFTIERMALEKHIDRDTADYRPKEPGLPRLLAKLKARKPVTIVTMGDSLTDKRHWANRERLWAEELVERLKTAYGSEVTLVNPAIGGTTLSQNVILMPRWLQESPSPDLVVIWFGGNDWDTGVRGDALQAVPGNGDRPGAPRHQGSGRGAGDDDLPRFRRLGNPQRVVPGRLRRGPRAQDRLRRRGNRLPQGRLARRGPQAAILGLGQRTPWPRRPRLDRRRGPPGHRQRRGGRSDRRRPARPG